MDHEELEEEAAKKKTKKKKKKMGSKKHPRLHRSFLHFSKAFKKLHAAGHGRPSAANDGPSPSSRSNPAGASSSLLSACMHPRTLSFSSGGGRQRHVTVHHRGDEDDDDSLTVNFRSLRIESTAAVVGDGSSSSAQAQEEEDCGRGSESEGEDGGGANGKAVAGGVAVVTFSVAPYEDFRRSMREMVDARRGVLAGAAAGVDWDLMEELLFCYLQLNDRAVHKDILRAFTDTVAELRRRRRKPKKSRRTRTRAGATATGDGVVQDQPAASS